MHSYWPVGSSGNTALHPYTVDLFNGGCAKLIEISEKLSHKNRSPAVSLHKPQPCTKQKMEYAITSVKLVHFRIPNKEV